MKLFFRPAATILFSLLITAAWCQTMTSIESLPTIVKPGNGFTLLDMSASEEHLLFGDGTQNYFIYDISSEKYVKSFKIKSQGFIEKIAFFQDDDHLAIKQKNYEHVLGVIELDYSQPEQSDFKLRFVWLEGRKFSRSRFIYANSSEPEESLRIYQNLLLVKVQDANDFNATGFMAFHADGKALVKFNKLAKPDDDNHSRIHHLLDERGTVLTLIKETFKRDGLYVNINTFSYDGKQWQRTRTIRNLLADKAPSKNTYEDYSYYTTQQDNGIFALARSYSLSTRKDAGWYRMVTFDIKNKKSDKITLDYSAGEWEQAHRKLGDLIESAGGISFFSKREGLDPEFDFEIDKHYTNKICSYIVKDTAEMFFPVREFPSSGSFTSYLPDDRLRGRKREIFRKEGNQSLSYKITSDTILHLDKATCTLIPMTIGKVNQNRFGAEKIQSFDVFNLISGSEFDIVPPEEDIFAGDQKERCTTKLNEYGLTTDLALRLKTSSVDSFKLDCGNYNVVCYTGKTKIKFNVLEILDSLHRHVSIKSASEQLKNYTYFDINKVSGNLIFLTVLDPAYTTIFIWNYQTHQLKDYYQYFHRGYPDDWEHFSDDDEYNFFYDYKRKKVSTGPWGDEFEGILYLYRFDLKNGEISPFDSTTIDIPNTPAANELLHAGNAQFCKQLGIVAISIPDKPHLFVLYDIDLKKFILNRKPFLKMDPVPAALVSYYPDRESFEAQRAADEVLHPLLQHIYGKVGDDIEIDFDLLAGIIDNTTYRDKIFRIHKDKRITLINGPLLTTFQFINGKLSLTKSLGISGSVERIFWDRNFLVTASASGNDIYNVYQIYPPEFLMDVKFDQQLVRFQAANGYFTEFSTFKNDRNDRITNRTSPFNRPDSILALLNSNDSRLMVVYDRVRALQDKKLMAQGSLPIVKPRIEVHNRLELHKVYRNQTFVDLQVSVQDGDQKVKRILVWVNGVPEQYPVTHTSTSAEGKLITSLRIQLSYGKNEIEVACEDIKGTQSDKISMKVYYVPASVPQSRSLFAGIGYSTYQDTSRNLTASAKDIHDLANLFKANDFTIVDTLINRKEDKESLLQSLNKKLRTTTLDDRIVVMLSGHGLLSADNLKWHFATYQTDFNDPDNSPTITFEDLDKLFEGVPARKRLILIDACHAGQSYFEYTNSEKQMIGTEQQQNDTGEKSGGDDPGDLPFKTLEGFSDFAPSDEFVPLDYEAFKIITKFFPDYVDNGTVVVTASRGEQTAREDRENGFFTHALMEVFKEYKAGTLTLNKLIERINQKFVQNADGQKPSLKGYNPSVDWIIW